MSGRSGRRTWRRSRRQADGVIQYETDRARFLGRGRSVRSPVSVIDGRPLSNTVGAVLDPIFSLRCRVRLAPGATVHAIFSTVVAESRDEVLDLADKYRESATFERAATLAWTQAQVQLHHLGIEADEAHLFQRLANRILYSDPSLRPSAGQCWPATSRAHPASGLTASRVTCPSSWCGSMRSDDLDIVRQLLRAHEYWRLKLLDVDLVILNEQGATYAQGLQDSLETLVRTSQSILVGDGHPGRGGVSHPARRPALRRGPDAPPVGCPGRPPQPSRQPGRPGHPPGTTRADGSAAGTDRLEAGCAQTGPHRVPSWSSSTASVASPRAGGNTSPSSGRDSRPRRRG